MNTYHRCIANGQTIEIKIYNFQKTKVRIIEKCLNKLDKHIVNIFIYLLFKQFFEYI
jgi:hypothetical protein